MWWLEEFDNVGGQLWIRIGRSGSIQCGCHLVLSVRLGRSAKCPEGSECGRGVFAQTYNRGQRLSKVGLCGWLSI